MVGSLIYGNHKVPKKSRPWKERWKLPTAVALVFLAIIVVAYEFCNYREEGAVKQFLGNVFSGNMEAAFSEWDLEGGSYNMKRFTEDWGNDGFYRKGATTGKVIDSNGKGSAVVVYVDIAGQRFPLALRVDKQTLKISYAPNNKYIARAHR